MANINQKNVFQVPIYNDRIDPSGPIAIPINFDFSAQTAYFVDGSQIQHLGFISYIQTIYVDTTAAAGVTNITPRGSQQTLKIPQGTQGYYPILCNQPWGIDFVSATAAAVVKVILFNNPISPASWPSV